MPPFLPNTDDDRRDMLATIGISSTEELFQDVPAAYRFPQLKLPKAVSEMEILAELNDLANKNSSMASLANFLGAGAYHHFVPSAIPYLVGRSEFSTAYTPYQPEVSQGTLQAIFEYQSMVSELTGMEVVNASHYDGATAMAEAAIMAINVSNGKRTRIVVAPSVHPQYRQTLRTYLPGDQTTITGDENLSASLADLKAKLDGNTACLIVQNPTFFGELLDVDGLADAVHAAGALLVVLANPVMSLGLLKSPGSYGADIVVAEGQPLGAGLNFGGPYLGIFATREKLMRKMPGRLIGKTTDTKGPRWLCAHPQYPRAAHPPRKSHQQYLLERKPGFADRCHVPGLYGQAGAAGCGRAVLSQSSFRRGRDRQNPRLQGEIERAVSSTSSSSNAPNRSRRSTKPC